MRPYIPFKLPLDKRMINIEELFNITIQANSKLELYADKINHSKVNPVLLVNLFTIKEALESSKIEGTQATMDDMFESKIDETKGNNETKEVFNYIEALYTGARKIDTYPITTRLIKELHSILMSDGVRGATRLPGEFRSIQNFVGKEGCTIDTATYVPPEPQLVNNFISNLEKFINEENELNVLIKIAIIHSQFETIHPFLDGNGRIGRILIPLFLYSEKKINQPMFFVSESLEKDKYKYYQLLNNTRVTIEGLNDGYDIENEEVDIKQLERAKKAYTEWIKFFLKACETECDKAINKINEIDELYDRVLSSIKGKINNTKIIDVIDIIFENPIFTAKSIRSQMNIASSTLNNYLNKLVEAGIIYHDDKTRNKKYYFYDLMTVLR